jgi:hypothetical protein
MSLAARPGSLDGGISSAPDWGSSVIATPADEATTRFYSGRTVRESKPADLQLGHQT